MGATLSKLWGSLRAALTGGGGGAAGKDDHNGNATAPNGHARDLESALPTSNTPAKPPTPIPDMGSVKKYEITEVRGFLSSRRRAWWG